MNRVQLTLFGLSALVAYPVYSQSSLEPILESTQQSNPALEVLYNSLKTRFPIENQNWIVIDGEEQRLYFLNSSTIISDYPISSGKLGFKNPPTDGYSPTGMHVVKTKFGRLAERGEILKIGTPTGNIAPISTTSSPAYAAMTSRGIWLSGVEPFNTKTYWEHIYIHGTNNEFGLGTPSSHGCFRMANDAVIWLYDQVQSRTSEASGTYVYITPSLEEQILSAPTSQ